MNKLVYIDPQSYSNLSLYDSNLLSELKGYKKYFVGNIKYEREIPKGVVWKPFFRYSKYENALLKSLSYVISIMQSLFLIFVQRPSIVHIQWIKIFAIDYCFIKVIQLYGCKVVYTAHNILPHNSGVSQFSNYRRIYKLVDNIIVHSIVTKTELMKYFDLPYDKIEIIPHGILASDIPSSILYMRIHELENVLNLSNKFVFLSMGLQSKYKGSDIIRDVWVQNDFLNKNSKLHLLIVGRSPDIDFSSLSSFPNVTMIDKFVPDLDFQAYLRLGNILLMPYRKISQSGVLATAISAHIPFLVSNEGGLPDPLKIASVGWNMGKASVESLADAMKKIIDNMEDVIYMKSDLNSWKKLEVYYSWEKIGRCTEELYNKCLL